MTDRVPTLGEAINKAVGMGMRDVMTLIPARVVRFDASRCEADCQILIKNVTEGEEGEREVLSWPVVPSVPVQFPGAGGYRMTCPIQAGRSGTIGSLIFSHRSLDKWLVGTGQEVDPELDHDHALTDAVFFPGLMPFGAPWSSVPTDHMSMGYDTGPQAHFHTSTIVLGDEATAQFVALSNLVNDGFDTILAAFDAHTHTCPAGTSGVPTPAIGSLPDTAASQVKAK